MNSLLLVSTILSLSLSGLVIQPDSKKQETLNTLLNAEAVLVKEKEIYFSNSIGYLEEYKDESNNTSTIFYLNSTSLDDLVSVYHDKSISEITNNDTLKNDLIAFSNKKHSIIDDANTVTLRSKAPNVNYDFNAEKFFPVSVSDHVTKVTNHYVSYSCINNVPNYMNTQFKNNGCVPTAMAMYLAYIQRNCPTARNIVELSSNELLPLQHTDNPTTVDSFIHYLGIEYFNTNNSGTLEFNIRPMAIARIFLFEKTAA